MSIGYESCPPRLIRVHVDHIKKKEKMKTKNLNSVSQNRIFDKLKDDWLSRKVGCGGAKFSPKPLS